MPIRHHTEILAETMLPRERWAYTGNLKPVINELVEAGLMQPAYGEFVMQPAPQPPEEISILGHDLVVGGKMISLYCLTPEGRTALAGSE